LVDTDESAVGRAPGDDGRRGDRPHPGQRIEFIRRSGVEVNGPNGFRRRPRRCLPAGRTAQGTAQRGPLSGRGGDADDDLLAAACPIIYSAGSSFYFGDAAMARAAGDPLVVIETPRLEWIIQNRCLWDVFYEHCNYFTMGALAHLCRRAGFRVIRQTGVFQGQYQCLELRLAKTHRAPNPPPRRPHDRLAPFARVARQRLNAVERQVASGSPAGRWAIWGAGAKGVALVNQLQSVHPTCVIDSNAAKQGCVIPGSRVPVVAPSDPRVLRLELILIANPNYAGEIASVLKTLGYRGRLQILR
jgi:hypothetical protein